ncbi:MAG: 4Fe-4S dicluster domain-containing protein [Anaerolineae bacterium]|nr:4Fe-4S dicluster domain-containing protein [Anaerolineae bacterium]
MKFTTRDQLKAWLDGLAAEMDLVAPRGVDGHVFYRPVASGDEVLFDYERPELSAKAFVFPDTEVFLRVEQRGKDVTVEEVRTERKQVIFGVRPCDAHGLAVIDALFLNQEPADAQYQHHRERTVLVGLACPRMWEGCFCTSMGGAPDDATHLDVLLREVEGGYAVEAVSEKGKALVKGLKTKQKAGDPPAPQTNADAVPVVDTATWRTLFNDKLWQRHGERCLSCRICTYVCPTCRCFDVVDRVVDTQPGLTRIERIRVWDACTSTNYRRAAGGHNSRPTKPGRIRNRFYCKFCYYPEDFGPLGCVGCGRCVVSCPVDIDITEIMRDVAAKGGQE